jgi:hypothetical protein
MARTLSQSSQYHLSPLLVSLADPVLSFFDESMSLLTHLAILECAARFRRGALCISNPMHCDLEEKYSTETVHMPDA